MFVNCQARFPFPRNLDCFPSKHSHIHMSRNLMILNAGIKGLEKYLREISLKSFIDFIGLLRRKNCDRFGGCMKKSTLSILSFGKVDELNRWYEH